MTGPELQKRPRHCRHCLGDGCPGDCVIDEFQCIHGWNGRHPRIFSWPMLLDRRWWHRVLWGTPTRPGRWS